MPQDNTQQPVQDDTNTMPVADVTPSGNPAPVTEPVIPTETPVTEQPVVPTTEVPATDTVTPAPAEPTTQVTQ